MFVTSTVKLLLLKNATYLKSTFDEVLNNNYILLTLDGILKFYVMKWEKPSRQLLLQNEVCEVRNFKLIAEKNFIYKCFNDFSLLVKVSYLADFFFFYLLNLSFQKKKNDKCF